MEALSILWFVLIAVLWTMYFVLEGFDFGVGMLLRIIGKDNQERTAIMRTIGPHWDGNEVWLLTAGGATFAAFPAWYASMFSGFYLALFLILVLLIFRVAAIEWRSKIDTDTWRSRWDWFHTVAAFLVPLIFGVAFANLVQGMKIEALNRLTLQVIPADQVATSMTSGTTVFNLTGGFWSLFTPYTILGGLALTAICFAHGAQYLALRTDTHLEDRANKIASWAMPLATVLGAAWVIWGQFAYANNVWAWIPLVVAALAFIGSAALCQPATRKQGWSFALSAVGIAGTVAWIFAAMAPDVMKSSINAAYSLTIANASSTVPTLQVMSIVALVLVPIVLGYTAWSYWVLRGRIKTTSVDGDSGLLPKQIRWGANFLSGKEG